MTNYKVIGKIDGVVDKEVIVKAEYPQQAIDKVYEMYGRIHFNLIAIKHEYMKGIYI